MDIDNIISQYRDIYESNVRDFNVLTTVHLSENDHTNILCEILNMKDGKEKPFMKSFVEKVLGIEYAEDFVAKTQIASIGINDKGYIDLLLESPEICIVIENKVCGAGDMDYQLLRYYYTYVAPDYIDKEDILSDTEIMNQVTEYWDKKIIKAQKEVYIVYLTETMEKQPDAKSLPEKLKSQLRNHYIHISYKDDIYSWLKDYVQPNIKQGKNGDATKSIDLYLHELENILGEKTVQNEWYDQKKKEILTILGYGDGDKKSPVELFIFLNKKNKELDKESKENIYKDNIYLLDLKNCVKYYQASIYKDITPQGWTIRCAETYIDIFPTTWFEKFGGREKSSVHFVIKYWNDKDKAKLELDIHDEACKKYLINDDDINKQDNYNTISGNIFKSLNKKIKKIKSNSNIRKDYEELKTAFKNSGKYYWNLPLNLEGIKWNPDDPKKFFEKFVTDIQIQEFVQLAKKDFNK